MHDQYAWSEELETGDPLVDKQHREIHELAAYVATAEDKPGELLHILDRLMAHVDCHFATEEALMARSGYDGESAERHRREHRALTQSAREAVLQWRAGTITSTRQLASFLRGWLVSHVQEHDRDFIAYVRSLGMVAQLPEPAPLAEEDCGGPDA